MFTAAWMGDVETLRVLLARGDAVDQEDQVLGWTPLMDASDRSHLECVRALIDAGAEVNKVSNGGRTALLIACGQGNVECARALIDAGAALDMVSEYGTALSRACRIGHAECARALIDAGAAVDKQDIAGSTALMGACHNGRLECARALIDARADVELTNREGVKALTVACKVPPVFRPLPNEPYDERQRREQRLEETRQGKARCALALIEAMAPIGDDGEVRSHDRAATLTYACERLGLLEVVLSTRHVITHAPTALAKARALMADAQGIIANFARDVLAALKKHTLVSAPKASP